VVSLILFSVISGAISSQVRDSSLSAVDRSLGFLFGLARGAVIVCIAYVVLKALVPPPEQPRWITTARSLSAIQQGAAMLESLIPTTARDQGKVEMERARQQAERALEAERALRNLNSPPARAESPRDEKGPSNKDQRDLDRLIEQQSQGTK
jgi:membrane protein required for colicin V production